MKVGDKVRVICETPFDCDDENGKVRHSRKVGEICDVIFFDEPNKAGEVVFTKDKYEKLSLYNDMGQFINVCDLEVIYE